MTIIFQGKIVIILVCFPVNILVKKTKQIWGGGGGMSNRLIFVFFFIQSENQSIFNRNLVFWRPTFLIKTVLFFVLLAFLF